MFKMMAIAVLCVFSIFQLNVNAQDGSRNYNYGNIYYYPQIVWVPQGTQFAVTALIQEN
jgi:hypothetical protein